MFKFSITAHRDPQGKITILASGEDATVCLEAYQNCTQEGDLVFIRKGYQDKHKSVPAGASPVTTKKIAKKKASQ